MQTMILDGKAVAHAVEADLQKRVGVIKEKSGKTPVLATILVGDDPSSVIYVRMKGNACKRVGMESLKVELPGGTTTGDLNRHYGPAGGTRMDDISKHDTPGRDRSE